MSGGHIELVEVGPRVSLQKDPDVIATGVELALVDRKIANDAGQLEVASLGNSACAPQTAQAEAMIADLPDRTDCTYIGLAPNKCGVMRALAAREGGARRVDQVACVAGACDTPHEIANLRAVEQGHAPALPAVTHDRTKRRQDDAVPLISVPADKIFVAQYGNFIDGFLASFDGAIEDGEMSILSALSFCCGAISHSSDWLALPPVLTADGFIADRICCAMCCTGDKVNLDFEGTDPQSATSINSFLNENMFKIFFGIDINMAFYPHSLFNDGFYDLIEGRLPEGSLLKPHFPAPVWAVQEAAQ